MKSLNDPTQNITNGQYKLKNIMKKSTIMFCVGVGLIGLTIPFEKTILVPILGTTGLCLFLSACVIESRELSAWRVERDKKLDSDIAAMSELSDAELINKFNNETDDCPKVLVAYEMAGRFITDSHIKNKK